MRRSLCFFHPYLRRLETLTADDSSKAAPRLLKDPGTLNKDGVHFVISPKQGNKMVGVVLNRVLF